MSGILSDFIFLAPLPVSKDCKKSVDYNGPEGKLLYNYKIALSEEFGMAAEFGDKSEITAFDSILGRIGSSIFWITSRYAWFMINSYC